MWPELLNLCAANARKNNVVLAVSIAIIAAIAVNPIAPVNSQKLEDVDTALVVSVDVSNSVDARRFRLQMDGIASALQDQGVLDAILNGPRGGILFSLVTWADRPRLAVPWRQIASKEEAAAVAKLIQSLPRHEGEFTCMGRMLRFVADKVTSQIPAGTLRTVVDVSGDGRDNCNPEEPIESVRDELVGYGTTINGLPILEGREKETLEAWYRENVKGGPGGFILPANGFADFGRAIRQKFVIEISGVDPQPATYLRNRHAARLGTSYPTGAN